MSQLAVETQYRTITITCQMINIKSLCHTIRSASIQISLLSLFIVVCVYLLLSEFYLDLKREVNYLACYLLLQLLNLQIAQSHKKLQIILLCPSFCSHAFFGPQRLSLIAYHNSIHKIELKALKSN